MDNFLAMERKGRDLFKSLLEDGNITKYKESTGRYNPVDFYLIHNEDKIVAEIKCRDIRYVNYPTHLMETENLKACWLSRILTIVKQRGTSTSLAKIYALYIMQRK